MKLAVIIAIATLMLCRAQANAGAVQVGLVNGLEFEKWNCGGAVPGQSRSKARCENAKFDETSTCDSVVITNDSSEAVKVELQVSGPGFEQSPNHAYGISSFGVFSSGPPRCQQRTIDDRCETLDPGHSCYQTIEFWPRDSGTSQGHIEVRVTGSAEPLTKSYDLVATAEYPSDLGAADEVRKAHLDQLMRIPHVVRVSLDNSNGDIVINVEVAHEEDIPKAQREAPPRLGGYRVEVVQEVERAWAM